MRQAAGLSLVAPCPAPLPLPDRYRRHDPDRDGLRAAIRSLAAFAGFDVTPSGVMPCDVTRSGVTRSGVTRSGVTGSWSELVEQLLAVGRTDIPLARLVEGHVDAQRILAQAGCSPVPDAIYGVWASRSRRTGVAATVVRGGLRLAGTLRFASGAGVIDRALIPAWVDDEHHRLVDLAVSDLAVDRTAWITTAMEVSRSHTVEVALEVGDDAVIGGLDFYLRRPGFFPGGVGVAACWAGGAARLTDLVCQRPAHAWSEAQLARLGEMRTQLTAAVAVIRAAAAELDRRLPGGGPAVPAPEVESSWQVLATEARAVVAGAVGAILEQARRIAGPAGLAYDLDLSRAWHDLDLYVLQQNRDGDRRLLGRASCQAVGGP